MQGAEVIAEDHVYTWSIERGLAHAGARGNRRAKNFCKCEIDAPQIRIADIVREKESV